MSNKSQINSDPDLVTTSDGSHTLYSNKYRQHYHNPGGAVSESRHIFFEKNRLLDALNEDERDRLTILEIGFGTGLNLLLLMDELSKPDMDCSVDFHTVEAYPIEQDLFESFNYGEHLAHPGNTGHVSRIFEKSVPGLNTFSPLPNLAVEIFIGLFEDYKPGTLRADYIFHDPFSPEVNEELWTGEAFKKLLGLSSDDALLSTYCAASKARGAMAWAGWRVAREEGALGKREMTLASPGSARLNGLERVNEQRLADRYESGDFD